MSCSHRASDQLELVLKGPCQSESVPSESLSHKSLPATSSHLLLTTTGCHDLPLATGKPGDYSIFYWASTKSRLL